MIELFLKLIRNVTARRRMCAAVLALAVPSNPALAGGQTQTNDQFIPIPVQYIAALGDPAATSGSNAQDWGLWRVDPGPRGVKLGDFEKLAAKKNVTPAGWAFDAGDWWLEERGLIMEKPIFPLQPGRYLVTGAREVTAVLTVRAKDKDGAQRWELADSATLADVTHLPCRSARYSPKDGATACTPAKAKQSDFPVTPGGPMPPVEGCQKQDYYVLFVVGLASDN
jgi:hypothetical protein